MAKDKNYKSFWDLKSERSFKSTQKEAEPFIKEMSKLFKQSE